MKFELLTLTGSKYDGEVSQVSLVTTNGALGILPHHEPLTAIAVPGPVTVRDASGREEVFATFGGMLEVVAEEAGDGANGGGANGGTVRLMADEAESSDELVTAEVAEALERAKHLRAEAKDKHELARAQELVDRQTVRLGVAKMRRHAGPRRETPSE